MSETQQVGYWPLAEPFPALLTDAQLRLVLGVGWTTFYRLKKLGRFRELVAHPTLTPTVRYSGLRVQQWVDGQWTHARTFGAKRNQVARVADVAAHEGSVQ